MFEQFKQYLSNKGIIPSIDNDNQIVFVREGLHYLFISEKDDSNYFRIILPNIFQIEKGDDTSKYQSVVNNLNKTFKVAKTYITDNGAIWVAAEQFVYSTNNLDDLFERCVVLLKIVIDQFREQQSKLDND